MTQALLQALAGESLAVGTLSRLLQCSRGQVELALYHLRRGGYVTPSPQSCSSGCGGCSVRSLCSQTSSSQPQDDTWHLTDKGRIRLRALD